MNQHIALRRGAGIAALAIGLAIGAGPPVTATAADDPSTLDIHRRPEAGQNRGPIQFAAGYTSASVNDAVARGDWHHWGVRAQRGQAVAVSISGGNSTFEVYTPSGDQLANDVTQFNGTASATGSFAIDVGSTGGLAYYTLSVSVTGTPTPAPPPAPPPAPGGLPGHFQGRIQFPAGASSGSVSGTVERGNWHEWSFRAAGGQSSTLTVSAAAGNSTFSVYAPNGNVLAAHTTSFSGALPSTGSYMIEVGSTGGSASYTLNLSITGSAAPPPPPAPPPAPGNLPGHFQGRIQFASGANHASVDGSVDRGNWHEWSFRAAGGQTGALSVEGGGGNATFSLYAPNGDVLAAHVAVFTGTLPASGSYMIEVGSTGGTAQYRLHVGIF